MTGVPMTRVLACGCKAYASRRESYPGETSLERAILVGSILNGQTLSMIVLYGFGASYNAGKRFLSP